MTLFKEALLLSSLLILTSFWGYAQVYHPAYDIMIVVFNMQLELLCDDNVLHKDSTLKFIWLSHWLKRDPPMVLNYRLKQRLG